MSKIEEVRTAMVAAMKAKDKETKESLAVLLGALKNKAIDKRADLTEEEEIQVVLKEIKQTKETLEMTPADRTDIINECRNRIAVLEQYAPKMMGETEIRAIIEETLRIADLLKDNGHNQQSVDLLEAMYEILQDERLKQKADNNFEEYYKSVLM